MKILVLNPGSSSQKSRLYEIGATPPEQAPKPIWSAAVEWGSGTAEIKVKNSTGASTTEQIDVKSRRDALEHILGSLWTGKTAAISRPDEIDIVGHRVVHGGRRFAVPTLVSPEVQQAIADLSSFAPLHNPAAVEGIEVIEQLLGNVPQVAVFDTAFHHNLPLSAAAYGGPYEWLDRGIRRYGFHGINHEYCAGRAAQLLGRDLRGLKLITCHLGNGCSLAAIEGGKSIDTTMGFTPLEGLVMGTRSGSIDPAIATYLMRQDHSSADEIDVLLNQRSGLLGLSGVSGDMREILKGIQSGNRRSQLAFDVFVHRLQESIGAMAAALGGLDALIFTAGIGENSPEVRAAACSKFEFLGVKLDQAKNRASPTDAEIATRDSRIRVLVIAADEDWAIARSCWAVRVNRV